MITSGISDAASYKISFGEFIKKGLPVVLIKVALAIIWSLLKF
jgi:Na+/H+ antiporter NhaD/arsenite permease-like protein